MSGSPSDKRRMEPLARGELDAIFDEALVVWFDKALKSDLVPLALEPEIFAQLAALGWRKMVAPKSRFPRLAADHACIDYSGWPLYANAALPEQTVYDVCSGFAARAAEYPVGRRPSPNCRKYGATRRRPRSTCRSIPAPSAGSGRITGAEPLSAAMNRRLSLTRAYRCRSHAPDLSLDPCRIRERY